MSNTRKAKPYLENYASSLKRRRWPHQARFARWLMAASAEVRREEIARRRETGKRPEPLGPPVPREEPLRADRRRRRQAVSRLNRERKKARWRALGL